LIVRAFLNRMDGDARFDSWQLQTVRVETSRHRVSVAVDGELEMMAPPLRYTVRPGALAVIVPTEKEVPQSKPK
jgi:diacylglycerol kinase family enzyme